MSFVGKLQKDFIINDNHFELSNDYLQCNKNKFKKITGTRFASILGVNHYQSPFKTWCQMVGIYTESIDPTLSIVGQKIEPKIREYVEKYMNIKFLCYNPISVKWDVFKEINKIFGGIPDGEPIDENGNFTYHLGNPMLEIKTSSIDSFVYKKINGTLTMQKDDNNFPIIKAINGKLKSWYDENNKIKLPIEYQYQLGLYLYLRNANVGLFAIGFLKQQDYAKPDEFIATKNNIKLVKFNIKNNFDIFLSKIDIAKKWYEKHIATGISPQISESDNIWLKEMKIL